MPQEEEKCVRCGDPGPDLRTLSMACLYEMSELDVPFERYAVQGRYVPLKELVKDSTVGITVPSWGEPEGELRLFGFYSLQVCKDCRASWMGAIQEWWKAPVEQEKSPGSGIFVRDKGRNVEISEEEWQRRHPGREPVRVSKTKHR